MTHSDRFRRGRPAVPLQEPERDDMTDPSDFDPEPLQTLLSNAFVVQESGMDTESLSAIVKLQGSIATGDFDLDGAMEMIAVRAQKVANAAGVAIGLMNGDQLDYRAGSGSAAPCVGQHVPATLCASGDNTGNGEILRVENAQTDKRIESAICRQFGAQSLLILPIHHDRNVAGVLEVLFKEAHTFSPREVRAYRLMAGLVEEMMSCKARLESKTTQATDLLIVRQSIGQRLQTKKSFSEGGSVLHVATNRAMRQACGDSFAATVRPPALKQLTLTASNRAKWVPMHQGRWATVVTVAAVLVLACWIAYRDREATSPLGASALQSATPIEQQILVVLTKPVQGNGTSKPYGALGPGEGGSRAARITKEWVRVDDNELDYVTEDVTVRYFNPNPARQRALDRNNQVHHFSEDVTVRYFTPQPAVAPPPVIRATQPANRDLPAPATSR